MTSPAGYLQRSAKNGIFPSCCQGQLARSKRNVAASFSFLFPAAFSPKDHFTTLSPLPVPDRTGGAREHQNLLHFKLSLIFPAWSSGFQIVLLFPKALEY